jgi:hypothetical protein
MDGHHRILNIALFQMPPMVYDVTICVPFAETGKESER